MKSFFIEMPNFWAWAENLTDNFIVIWGIFGQFISTHFDTVSPLSMFFINQPLFLPKLSIYIQIQNTYLGVGFEFGPQRVWDLAIVCP
jgi:hypothetical protein